MHFAIECLIVWVDGRSEFLISYLGQRLVFPCPNSGQEWPDILDKGWQHCAGGGGNWTENIRVVQTFWFRRVVPIIVFDLEG
jgi:hypothetical protein